MSILYLGNVPLIKTAITTKTVVLNKNHIHYLIKLKRKLNLQLKMIKKQKFQLKQNPLKLN